MQGRPSPGKTTSVFLPQVVQSPTFHTLPLTFHPHPPHFGARELLGCMFFRLPAGSTVPGPVPHHKAQCRGKRMDFFPPSSENKEFPGRRQNPWKVSCRRSGSHLGQVSPQRGIQEPWSKCSDQEPWRFRSSSAHPTSVTLTSDLLPRPGSGVGHRLTLCGRQMGRAPEAVGRDLGGAGPSPSHPHPLPPPG